MSLLAVIAVAGGGADARTAGPVSSGPVATDTARPSYAPDHVMVRLTRDGYDRSRLKLLVERGKAAAGAETGLASLDATSRDLGVTRIAKAHGPCNDRALAAGRHEATWAPRRQPSGIYVAKLSAGASRPSGG